MLRSAALLPRSPCCQMACRWCACNPPSRCYDGVLQGAHRLIPIQIFKGTCSDDLPHVRTHEEDRRRQRDVHDVRARCHYYRCDAFVPSRPAVTLRSPPPSSPSLRSAPSFPPLSRRIVAFPRTIASVVPLPPLSPSVSLRRLSTPLLVEVPRLPSPLTSQSGPPSPTPVTLQCGGGGGGGATQP